MSSAMSRGSAVIMILFAALLPASARVWYVNAASASPDGNSFAHGFHTITDAMNAATGSDEVWVEKGDYKEHVLMVTQRGLYGGFAGTETSRDQADPVANVTTITGSGPPLGNVLGSCIGIDMGATNVMIDGFTLRDGTGHKYLDGSTAGGGIFADDNSQFVVTHCTFRTNHSAGTAQGGATATNGYGGAIYYTGFQTPWITDNTFISNDAWLGGAIYFNNGNAIIQRNTFSFNNAVGNGGAITAVGGRSVSFLVTDNTFNNNTAQNGGVLYGPSASDFLIGRNTLYNNTAGQNGGGFYMDGATQSTVFDNYLNGNKAGAFGGGIYCDGSTSVEIASNILLLSGASNSGTVTPHGGGIFDVSSIVSNNTIVNSTHEGLWIAGSNGRVSNNILYSNDTGIATVSPTAAVLHNNDLVGNTVTNYTGIAAGAGDISVNPLFVNSGGADFHLTSSSPCVDAGSLIDAYTPVPDIDGEPRIMGSSVDIGADELTQTLVFTSEPGNGYIGQPLNPQPVVTVEDAAGNPITSFNGTIKLIIASGTGTAGASLTGTTIVHAVSGVAAFSGLAIDTVGHSYQLQTDETNFAAATSAAFNILLARAYAKPSGSDANDGSSWATAKQTLAGAIGMTGGPSGQVWAATGNYAGSITVPTGVMLFGGFNGTETDVNQRNTRSRATVITGTSANAAVRFLSSTNNGIDTFKITGGGGTPILDGLTVSHREGGGVYSSGASPAIRNCLITGNSATIGGGVAINGGHPTIQYDTITLNSAVSNSSQAGLGGGISLGGGSGVVSDNFIENNAASGTGAAGGAMDVSGSWDIHNNTLVGNQSPVKQGDVYIVGGSPAFANNIINNQAAIEKTGGTPTFSHNDYIPGSGVANPLPSINGTNGNINVTPGFVNTTTNFHLATTSPLINQGDNSVVIRGETDVDGEDRINAGTVDIGADEVQIAPYTLSDVDSALMITGGLQAASSADISRLDVESPAGIDLLDATRLARKLAGVDANP